MTVNASGNSFFIFGNKDKLWIVGNTYGEQYIHELKNYSLHDWMITLHNETHNIFSFGETVIETNSTPVEIDLKLSCDKKDFLSIGNSNLGPEDFYSMPEITKLSKIITKKLFKMKKK